MVIFHSFYGWIIFCLIYIHGFPGDSDSRESAYSAGDPSSMPGSGRSPKKDMATHSSFLAWRIPWIEEPGGLQSMGLQRVRHNWVAKTYIFMYMYIHTHTHIHICTHTHTHVFLIQFSVAGHWDCFLVLATEKRAALNIGGHASLPIRVFSRRVPRSGLAGSHDKLF